MKFYYLKVETDKRIEKKYGMIFLSNVQLSPDREKQISQLYVQVKFVRLTWRLVIRSFNYSD